MDRIDQGNGGPPAAPKATATIAAAACWWIALFLLLVALTVDSLASAPDLLRLIVVGLAAVALAVGFFLVYARRPAPGTLVGLRRFNVVMMWLVAAGVAAYAVVPGGRQAPRPVASPALVTVNPGVDEAQLASASKRTFTVRGMVCQSCVETVTQALLGVPGVLAADVELSSGTAVVSSSGDTVPPDTALVSAVVKAGYKAWRNSGGDGDGGERGKDGDD